MILDDRRKILRELVRAWGFYMQPSLPFLNATLLLAAIAENESTFGVNNVFRHEASYDKDGYYFGLSDPEEWNYSQYGAAACGSRSSFQLLYPTALELGMPRNCPPTDLDNDAFAIIYVVKYILQRSIGRDKCASIEEIGDSYNTGSSRKGTPPKKYIEDLVRNYNTVSKLRGV